MKHFIAILAIAVLFVTVPQARSQGKSRTITGTVVDVYCLVTMGMEGTEHKECSEACVRNGAPLGIKEDKTGSIYLVAGQKKMTYASTGLEKHLEERVTARGKVYEKNGVKMILVDSAVPAK